MVQTRVQITSKNLQFVMYRNFVIIHNFKIASVELLLIMTQFRQILNVTNLPATHKYLESLIIIRPVVLELNL